jgi:hypothetical protein
MSLKTCQGFLQIFIFQQPSTIGIIVNPNHLKGAIVLTPNWAARLPDFGKKYSPIEIQFIYYSIMTVSELRTSLHEAIDHEDDETLLNIIQSLLIQQKQISVLHKPLHISSEQIKELELSCRQYKNGETIELERANQMIDQWLSE